MVKQILLISTLLIPNIQKPDNPQQSLILFERIYRNPHDAFQIRGEMIDGQGKIHAFNNRNDKPGVKFRDWNLGEKDYLPLTWQLTAVEVQKNLSLTDSVIGAVNPDTLSKYLQMLSYIAESNRNFGSTLVVCATTDIKANPVDTISLYGFIFDFKSSRYKRIKIEEHSRVEWENQSDFVNEFKQWKWKR